MRKQFVMQGQIATSGEKVLRLSGISDGYGYVIDSFQIGASTNLGASGAECFAAITRAKVAMDPINPNWSDDGLVATATAYSYGLAVPGNLVTSMVNDMAVLTQDLILSARETDNSNPINYLIKFRSVKMTGPEEAATNYKQFSISDE